MVDNGGDRVQDGGTSSRDAHDGGDGSVNGLTSGRRRRPPSTAEQERRKEWGTKWGKMVSEAVREAIGETE